MSQYQDDIKAIGGLKDKEGSAWNAINPESAARMRAQNRFKTHLDIANYTAKIMRDDMAAYDADSSKYTQSLGCWHGFIGQQKMISIKKHFNSTDRRYLYLSGWMIAALRSEFGPLPDQSMHEKTAVADLIRELYTFLRQADARELGGLFRQLDAAEGAAKQAIQDKIDNFVTHVVPIIADIDAGFGNAEATYLMAKQMIEAGACCIQIENQVSDGLDQVVKVAAILSLFHPLRAEFGGVRRAGRAERGAPSGARRAGRAERGKKKSPPAVATAGGRAGPQPRRQFIAGLRPQPPAACRDRPARRRR